MVSKRVSVYSKTGLTAATTYYRFYQFFKQLDITVTYRKMLSDKMYDKCMPISEKPIYVKMGVMAYILVRVLTQLTKDSIRRPDVVIVSRRFSNRIFPSVYKLLLNRLKRKGTRLVWDFDDEIIQSREISRKNFNYMSRLSDVITVAGQPNKNMVLPEYRDKAVIIPTTDGDMYQLFTPEINKKRLDVIGREIRVVWVGTSVSLPFVKGICQHFEAAADELTRQGKRLVVTIVCNRDLDYQPVSFELRNIRWQRKVAISEMLDAHIGIMPLAISIETKAKGGFKLIQYLSIGLPVVGTGLGINNEIIDSSVGFTVDSLDSKDWTSSILDIVSSKDRWQEYSHAAYRKWLSSYSYESNLDSWAKIINCNKL